MKWMNAEEIKKLNTSCCQIGVVSIADNDEPNKAAIIALMPNVKNLVIVAHHIQNPIEWLWFPFQESRRGRVCSADFHVKISLGGIRQMLEAAGHEALILPYPGVSGIRFKSIASLSSLGGIGKSALFLHHTWGPWVHLGILATDADIENDSIKVNPCTECRQCLNHCPSGAIQAEDFNGLQCMEWSNIQKERYPLNHVCEWSCENCLRSCPIGTAPAKMKVSSV